MKTIINNKFFEFNFILFPIWILPIYFLLNSIIGDPKFVFLIFLLLFGEAHFASTFLFFFEKRNQNYVKENLKTLVYIPLILALIYVIIGIIDFKTAVLLGAIASGFHVTRQSVGIQRLYGDNRKYFYEFITYISSFTFLFVGFYRFYLSDLLQRLNLSITLNNHLFNGNNLLYFYILLVVCFACISLSEKSDYKKKIINLTGVLIYSPYLFVDNIYAAGIIGVGAHWCQYLAINYKVYFYNQKFDFGKKCLVLFIVTYSLLMSLIGYELSFINYINYLILIPLTGQFIHYYIDAFIWKFSDPHIRKSVGKYLFS